MNLLNLGILLAVLGVFGFFYMHSVRSFEQQMAKADARDASYEKSLDDLQTQWKSDQKEIATLQAQKDKVSTQIVYRDKSTDAVIAVDTAPDRSASQVSADVQSAYQFTPTLNGNLFEFTLPQTQTFVATKLDRNRLSTDNTDLSTQLGLETKVSTSLETDLTSAKTELQKAQDDIKGYKTIAKKSGFRRFLEVTEKVALVAGSFYIGTKF